MKNICDKNKKMNCCTTNRVSETKGSVLDEISGPSEAMAETDRCVGCNGKGKAVSRKTVILMLKPDSLERAMSGSYSFCQSPDCPVVYFEETGARHFTVDDLRIRVGLKVKDDPIPLCYCFGFDESHIREEIAQTGHTSVPARIARLIREGLCACDTRNPAGVCCLGEVNKCARRLALELVSVGNQESAGEQ